MQAIGVIQLQLIQPPSGHDLPRRELAAHSATIYQVHAPHTRSITARRICTCASPLRYKYVPAASISMLHRNIPPAQIGLDSEFRQPASHRQSASYRTTVLDDLADAAGWGYWGEQRLQQCTPGGERLPCGAGEGRGLDTLTAGRRTACAAGSPVHDAGATITLPDLAAPMKICH